MDLLSLQRLLGHSSLEMVRKYAQLSEADLRYAHERASPIDKGLKGNKRPASSNEEIRLKV